MGRSVRWRGRRILEGGTVWGQACVSRRVQQSSHSDLCALIDPYYSKAANGRPLVGVERMLRIYFLQQWFNLSDPGVEEALYDSVVMRQFAGIDLGQEPAPDETTVCKFRHLLEEHAIGGEILQTVNLYLQSRGVKITTGTNVDATIIHAPSSTKNREQQRDPEMHQTRKGKHWYFGMKAPVRVDSQTKMIHSVVATAANVADSRVLPELLHGEETKVWGDQAYRGQTEAMRAVAPAAQDLTNKQYCYKHRIDEVERAKNRSKSRVRFEGGARVCGAEVEVRIREGTLSRAGEECQPAGCDLCVGQPVSGAPEAHVPHGVVSLRRAPPARRRAKVGQTSA
jgi:IS5 family transposase